MAGVGAPEGNDYARKGKVFYDAMRKAITQDNHKRLAEGMQVVLNKAAEGERWALEMIRDTLDGKPKQQVEVAGEDGKPIEHNHAVGISDTTRGLLEAIARAGEVRSAEASSKD